MCYNNNVSKRVEQSSQGIEKNSKKIKKSLDKLEKIGYNNNVRNKENNLKKERGVKYGKENDLCKCNRHGTGR